MVYNYTNRQTEIDLTKISGAKKKAWWMNPMDGALEYIGEFTNGKQPFIHKSGSHIGNDKVLIIIDSTKTYIAIDQNNIL